MSLGDILALLTASSSPEKTNWAEMTEKVDTANAVKNTVVFAIIILEN